MFAVLCGAGFHALKNVFLLSRKNENKDYCFQLQVVVNLENIKVAAIYVCKKCREILRVIQKWFERNIFNYN